MPIILKKIRTKFSLIILPFLFLSFFVFPLSALAGIFEDSMGLKKTADGTGHTKQKIFNSANSIEVGAGMIIQIILSFVGVIFMAIFIYSGILWMTAGGNDQRIEKAKRIMTESIIGLIITLLAYAITYFVLGAFIGQNLLD